MTDAKDIKTSNDKVFFIVSNQLKIDKLLDYNFERTTSAGVKNLKRIYEKQTHYNREEFKIYVYCFEVISKEKKQKVIINLKYLRNTFSGEINFREKTTDKIKHFNTFIYDFKFQDYNGWTGIINPPPSINLQKVEQLKIFHDVLKALKIKVKDILSITLITDSQCYLREGKFALDFYLEILKWCYTEKGIKTLLMMFNMEKVYFPKEFDKKSYFRILEIIEKKPEFITKQLSEKDSKEKYFRYFYTLLLFYRVNYEEEKVQTLLNDKNARKYLIEILPKAHKFFPNLDVSDELINEMLNQKEITFQIIKESLSYGNSFEKVLYFINSNIDLIGNCCIKESQKINMIEMANPNQNDDLNKLIEEIKKILDYQKKNRKVFVLFNEDFWKNYIHYNDKINLKNLILIKKAVLLCQETDKKISYEKLALKYKIHTTGILTIIKGELKNEELINFIENEDVYFKDKTYESKNSRPLEILKGIDLNSANEKFFESWNKSSIFKMYSFCDYEFKKELVNLVTDMKDFGKLLKLFDYKNKKIFDNSTTALLRERFKNIITTYKPESCPHFIEDISFYIYIIDYTNNNETTKLLEKTIEKYIKSVETVNDIYLYLVANYKDISKTAIEGITNYFTKNKDKLNGESILFLLKKLDSPKIVKSILNKINSCVIKEEQVFSEEKDIDSFILLDGIQKEKLMIKFPELGDTSYFISILELSKNILSKIEKGEIKYKLVYSFFTNPEKKNLLKQRFNIILFNNKDDVEKCLKLLDEKFKKFLKAQFNLKKYRTVINEFYEITFQKDLKLLDELQNKINTGMINIIENIQGELDKIPNKIPDLDKKYKLKSSIFFSYFYKNKKAKKIVKKEEEELFNETEEEFKKLKTFFEKDWFKNFDESLLKECYKALNGKTKQDISKELKFLKDYFGLKEFKDLDLEKLQDEIRIFSKKEEIFQTVSSCIHFIFVLGAKRTEFFDELVKLRKELTKSISVDQIKEYGETLEKFGINIFESNSEDKDYIIILNSLNSKKGSLKFIMKLTDEDCRTLQEIVSEADNSFLTSAEIQDMTKCSNFIHSLNVVKNTTTDKDLIKILKEKISQTKGISAHFILYTNNSGQIQELFAQKLDKSQATLKQIKNIVNGSNFTLFISKSDEIYLKFNGNFINDEKVEKEINFDNLIELRGRAMLTKKLGNEKSKEEKQIHEFNKKFAERVNEIEKINELLKKIGEKGYSEDIKISINIKDGAPVFCYEENRNFKNFKDYEDCISYLNNILIKTIDTQLKYYKKKETELIRYIYGRQFNLLNCYLKNFKNDSSLSAFLKYLTNDRIDAKVNLDNIPYDYDYTLNQNDNYVCLLDNINKFLTSFLKKNNITLHCIYEQNIIKEEYKNDFKGLYTYLLQDDKDIQKGVEEHILNWFHFLTGNPPMAQTVLLCNEETSSEEIISFMYRAFLCQYHVIFMVGKIELLTPEKRQTLTSLINTLFTGHEKEMQSCLAFAYSDKTSSIVLYLERIKGRKILKHADKKPNEEILYDEKVEIISSDKSGVGKSTQICDNIEKKGKKYIHFPFGGEFNRKDVINRLKYINSEINKFGAEKAVIHLDLYDSKQVDLMKDFLYSFLITKLYGQNEALFFLSKKVEIKIEIPNGFVNFFLKFPILGMFRNRIEMKIDNLPPLKVPAELDSNVQIVCNYLKLLKSGKLADQDLYIKNVSIDVSNLLSEQYIKDYKKLDATSLNQKECESLIKEYIGIKSPTYYQINSFINALSGQLKKFSMTFSVSAGNLIQSGNMLKKPNLKNMRVTMVNSFIKNTQHFTQGAFNKLLDSQLEAYKIGAEHGQYDEKKQDEIAINALSSAEEIISFDKIKPSLVFFHEGNGQEFSIISTSKKNEQDYQDLLELIKVPVQINNAVNAYNKKYKKEKIPENLNEYNKFTHKMFLSEIKKILNIENPVFKSDKTDNNDKNLKSVEEIVGEYVFTADNFIKMILILLRIRENIPVIMMGETGCGKTSLIRKLSELINKGESKMKILNIHAGITDKEIVDFLTNSKKEGENMIPSIIEEAEALEKSEKNIKNNYQKQGLIYYEKKIWIFLDEINTCNCMGLICELMTKHSYQGKKLPNNIVFIGACNPYRRVVKDEEPNGLKIAGTEERKLVYTVNPLPHSLLNFVFNFGKLTEDDEKSYIRNMIIDPIESFYWKKIKQKKDEEKKDDKELKIKENEIKNEDDKKSLKNYLNNEEFKEYEELKEMASGAIIDAQQYVRSKNDVSSVSLREIRRFSIFYDFFVEYLRKKKTLYENMNENENFNIDRFYKNLTDFEIYKNSINLSVYVCYYLRLTKKEFRDELSNKMNRHFKSEFIQMPNKEREYISNNIEMKEGIAKNRALLDNIFALFVCINSKVPLFIVGKPGCSKSLSVQLLFKSMKGDNSDNNLFKSLPKLILHSYQGSLGSTSKGVLSIFKKARSTLEKENDEDLSKMISMIYFDEMGLAEHSPNNPLKVIHSELEYDLNEGRKKIAFVGISNWRLDASKMNRGLYLSIPQPDLEDLKITAQTIAESYNQQLAATHKDLFETLAVTYHEYKNELSKKYTSKEDFHGSRDFYHLIKNAMRNLLNKASDEQNVDIDDHTKESIGIESLERNLGGLEFDDGKNGISSLEIVKKIFQRKYVNCPIVKNYEVLKRIKENINDNQSRYLLLISKSSISSYLLNTILNEDDIKKESIFYIGSGFERDHHSEQYTLKILNKVQLQMEQKKVLLLTDLEPVYPALYDLFNQNFTVVSEKNYARIAIGSSTNTFSLVNDNFKCIVLVDEKQINKQEAPFLNRFEKHIISFDYLLTENLLKTSEEICSMINDLANPNIQENKIKIEYDINQLLINCDEEEIKGIVYSKYNEYKRQNKQLHPQELKDIILEKISLMLPQDIILLMKYSGFEQKYNKISDKIIDYYQKGEHNNLFNFIKNMKTQKNIIFTFTSIDEPLLSNQKDDFETKMFGKINRNNIKEIQINTYTSENELEAEIEQIYLDSEDKYKIIVFKFNPIETDIMNYLKHFIENLIKEKSYIYENKNKQKAFIFSVHMNRIFESDKKDKRKKKYIQRNELGELISHLSDFYQIFIDNLNGEDISIADLIKYKDKELFQKCINLKKEFTKNMYDAFSYFSYSFSFDFRNIIDKDNYPIKVITLLEDNEELSSSIIDCILSQKFNNQNDILGEILKKNYITSDDVGIISVIQRYLSELFTDNLTQFVFKTEKDHFLSTFIFNQSSKEILEYIENLKNIEKMEDKKEEIINANGENKTKEKNEKIFQINNEEQKQSKKFTINNEEYYMGNQLVKKLIGIYLQTLDISNTARFRKKIKANKISVLLGLKLPGMKLTLNSFRNYVRDEISEHFLECEKNVKYLTLEEDEKEEDNIKDVNNLKNKIKNDLKNMETELKKNEIFQKLIDFGKEYQEDNRKFYELLLDDYYLLFLSDIIQDIKNSFDNLDNYKNILKKMVYLRFNSGDDVEEVDQVKSFAMKIVWFESNSEYISIILNIYKKILDYDKNLFKKINDIIEGEKIKYEISNRAPSYTKEINAPFFFTMESILKIIITDFDFKKLKEQEFYDFMNSLKGICQDALRIVNELSIFSKEVFTIQQFLAIVEKLNLVNKMNLENILFILKILSNHAEYTNNLIEDSTKYKDLSDNIQSLYNFLLKELGDTDDFSELMLKIFLDEIKKIENENYRKTLVELVVNNPKLIGKSFRLLSFILSDLIYSDPNAVLNNLDDISTNHKLYLEPINKSNNDVLNEIILYIFENQFNSYFNSLTNLSGEDLKNHFNKFLEYRTAHDKANESCLLLDLNLKLFEKCLNFLENLYNNRIENNEEKMDNELLSQFYCISYIKIYLFKCIYYNHKFLQEFIDFDKIIKVIEGQTKNSNFRRIIKIYVFKVFFYLLNNDYQEFSKYHFPDHQIEFFKDFKDKFAEQIQAMLSYYLLPRGDEYNKYNEELEKFESYRFKDFNSPIKPFKDYIEKHGIDIFYCISSNIVVSNLALKTYVVDSNEYSKYSSFVKSLFGKDLKIPEIIKRLFLLFSNDDEFNKKMKPRLVTDEGLTEINATSFEILLYSLRICLKTAKEDPKGFIYAQLLDKDCEKKLKENSFPGNNILDNIFVTNYYTVEKHLNKNPSNIGAYVCSCGLYYDIHPCGFPSAPSTCSNCLQPIGYAPRPANMKRGHGMVLRKGHYRIFKDQAQKDGEMRKYGDTDVNIPNKILADYYKEVIFPKIEGSKFGINKIPKITFENANHKVRNLSIIGYRLLNFVLYSHLFFSNCLGFIKNENMNNYICDGMTCIKMLVTDWNLLKDALQSKGIQVIQIFLNMIFNKFGEKLSNCKELKTIEERDKFEAEIEKMLEESYKEYEEYSKKYLELNQEAL